MIATTPPSLSGKYQHLYSGDDAFDANQDGYAEAYRKWSDSGDASLLDPFVNDDMKPMVFTLHSLSYDQKEVVLGMMRDAQAAESDEDADVDAEGKPVPPPIPAEAIVMMCRIGLRGIKGLLTPAGDPVPFKRHLSKRHDVKLVSKVTLNWLGQVDKGALIAELGLQVFINTFTPPD